jgi:hypothetical protein
MADENPLLRILQLFLALLLLGAIVFAGRSIYRNLPKSGVASPAIETAANFELNIVLRDLSAGGQTQVELYPFEYGAFQRDYMVNGRPGRNFEEYLAQRLRRLAPVTLQIDYSGHGKARLTAGPWWMRARLAHANGEVMEWRLPLVMSQSVHTVELTGENAYERTKKF